MLGVTATDIDYLTRSLLDGVRSATVSAVRDNAPYGFLCDVLVPVRGLRERAGRVVDVVTAWEIRHDGDSPRLVTAYIGE
jgi:hypothetical protein